MRILMLTQWFDPEPTFKGLLFAQELQRQGHDVRVLTGFPNYPGGKLYEGYKVRLLQKETLGGVRVVRVPLYPSHDSSGVRRILNYVSFALSATVAAIFLRRPDITYVYHPPATIGLPAVALKYLKGVPFVLDVQDLWPDTLAATGMVNAGWKLWLAGRLMKRIYRSAATVVVLSDGFRSALIGRSIPARRVEVIPNWADENQIEISSQDQTRPDELGSIDEFVVTFAGNMGKAQSLETVLQAAELLKGVPQLRFALVGGGVEFDSLRDQANRLGLPNVDFLPRRPISEIGAILAGSDALLVHLRDDPLFEITVPSKTQAYLMVGRPILMGVRGDAATMIKQSGGGIAFDPEDPAAMTRAVMTVRDMSAKQRLEMGKSGQRFYTDQLSLGIGAKRFGEVFERARLSKPIGDIVKRSVDIVGASVGLIVLSLPMAATALLVKAKLGSPVVFRQARPGLDDQEFRMAKFRTMTDERDDEGNLLPDSRRLTKFGNRLRSTSADEFPELLNVLRGEMSLVGPRPLLPRYSEFFSEAESLRFDVKPGITGWAQIHGRNASSWDDRLALDVWYVKNRSLLLDIKILVLTVGRVFRGAGVNVDPESAMQNLDDERRSRVA